MRREHSKIEPIDRAGRTVAVLAIVAAAWLTPARGQNGGISVLAPGFYNGMTPNSTVPGDVMRMSAAANAVAAEAGAYATVLNAVGQYQLNAAHATAIDSATMMAWNEYYHAVLDEQTRRNRLNRAARHKRIIDAYNKRRDRVANDPEVLDLLLGDAMNAMLEKLSNPRIHPSSLRGGGEELPGETIQQVTFLFASSRVTISLGRLTVRDGWPLALRGARFDRYRAAYAAAIDELLERCRTKSLTPEALTAAERAVAGLDGQLRSVAATLQADDFARARIFLDEIAEAVKAVHDATTETVLGGIDRYAGTTTGDLVVFMQRFNLRFGPALRAEEREAYHLLYAAMLHLDEQVAPATAPAPDRFLQAPAPAANRRPGEQRGAVPPPAVKPPIKGKRAQ